MHVAPSRDIVSRLRLSSTYPRERSARNVPRSGFNRDLQILPLLSMIYLRVYLEIASAPINGSCQGEKARFSQPYLAEDVELNGALQQHRIFRSITEINRFINATDKQLRKFPTQSALHERRLSYSRRNARFTRTSRITETPASVEIYYRERLAGLLIIEST